MKPDYYAPNWFSNMLPMEEFLVYEGVSYRTVEHFYQAMKTKDKAIRNRIASISSPYGAKKYRNIQLREDWDEIRLDVMEYALRHKFKPWTTYYVMLTHTENHEIIEWNYQGDTFWGKDIRTGEGENHLGKILMKLRTEFEKGPG